MCGIVGIVLADDKLNCCDQIYEALVMLQHRGQDAAGIATCDYSGAIKTHKDRGLVNIVFQHATLLDLSGYMGIGHCRYPTAGSNSKRQAQPFTTPFPIPMALAHNGNLTNTEYLHSLCLPGMLQPMTTSDSELLMVSFANEISKVLVARTQREKSEMLSQGDAKRRRVALLTPQQILDAATTLQDQAVGGYAVVILLRGLGVCAFRDPHGIRPLMLGRMLSRNSANGSATAILNGVSDGGQSSGGVQSEGGGARYDYIVASESAAMDALGYEIVREVRAGEAIFIDTDAKVHSKMCQHAAEVVPSPCIFEFVYFARPDSLVNGVSVHATRREMGEMLGKTVLEMMRSGAISLDAVIPVPETSRTMAVSVAQFLQVALMQQDPDARKIQFSEGFVKNRYIARTFIIPGQKNREKNVRMKFNVVSAEFAGKSVLLIDDSIVRGTTSRKLVQLARDAGATKVYFASASPPIRYENVYGIDMPVRSELIAHNRTVDEVGAAIGADAVIYLSVEDLKASVRKFNPDLRAFDLSCFTGNYVTGDIDDEYFSKIASQRADKLMHNSAASIVSTSGKTAVMASPRENPSQAQASNSEVLSISILDFPLEFTDNEK